LLPAVTKVNAYFILTHKNVLRDKKHMKMGAVSSIGDSYLSSLIQTV